MNPMELPKKITIEDTVIDRIPSILEQLGKFKSILLISGKKTYDLVGKKVKKDLEDRGYRVNNIKVDKCTETIVNSTTKKSKPFKPDLILGIGG